MSKLRIAIQKSGRLSDDSLKLLKDCSIKFPKGKNKLIAASTNFPAEILYLRDDDIPQYVENGIADVGILGQNVVEEVQKAVRVDKYLGFSKCRLSLAVPKEIDYQGVAYFSGKKIATSYPVLTEQYLAKYKVKADIEYISGSVEIAPSIGLASGICDLVSTGGTLLSNGLKEVEVILKSEAVVVSNPNLQGEKQALLNKLLFRIDATLKAKNFKYILLNAPSAKLDAIIDILPGMKSPTVLPLAKSEWSSVHSVVNENDFWNVIDQLQANGAEGILVVPIEKMVL
ncbi:MAG: ATP phosphoribosyltransferase [Saprospiraceae bacterium]